MSQMLIAKIAARASTSGFYRFLLNRILAYAVPFNRPHRLRIEKISKGFVSVKMPFVNRNRNHVNSVHACALATLCEFTSGISLMTLLQAEQYRIVLKSLKMDYEYRAKGDVVCEHTIETVAFIDRCKQTLDSGIPLVYETTAQVFDLQKNLICSGVATWQIKSWSAVKSK